MAEYNGNLLRPDRLAAMVDELAPIIRPAVKDESVEAVRGDALENRRPATEESAVAACLAPANRLDGTRSTESFPVIV